MRWPCRAVLLVFFVCLLYQHGVLAEEIPQQVDPAGVAATEGEQELPEQGEEVAKGPLFKFRGPEWHPQSFGTTQCSAPTPHINESGNIFDCRILRDTCVDQGVIIYQDQRYHPWTGQMRLPVFNITDILWNTPSLLGIGDKWRNGKNRYSLPHVRPWHHMEESEDIRRPVFSNCTTPLLFFHHFPFNVAEVYRFAVNNIYFLQQRLQFFDDYITLVPGTPPMSRVPSYTSFWLQPFSRYAVTSLGDLSARRPAGNASSSTGEGVAVRCFSRFIMCKITLKKPTGAFFQAGQFVAEYYQKQAAPLEANFTSRLAASMPPEIQYDAAVLKVVFAVRSKSHKDIGRVLLNEDELIQRCNSQELGLSALAARNATIFTSVHCIRHVFGVDNLYDMWLVRRMDVLVGLHGSALTNAMFMRRGSSLIELRPFGFSGRESWPNIYMKAQTRRLEVFWFGVDVMNASLSTPGDFEADMQPSLYTAARGILARDRNLALPWAALRHQLLNVAVCSRNVWRYKVLRHSHAYYITHDLQPLELRNKTRAGPIELLTWFTDPDAERTRAAAIPLTPEGATAAAAAEEAVFAAARQRREEEAAAAEAAEGAAAAVEVAEGAAAAAAGVGVDAAQGEAQSGSSVAAAGDGVGAKAGGGAGGGTVGGAAAGGGATGGAAGGGGGGQVVGSGAAGGGTGAGGQAASGAAATAGSTGIAGGQAAGGAASTAGSTGIAGGQAAGGAASTADSTGIAGAQAAGGAAATAGSTGIAGGQADGGSGQAAEAQAARQQQALAGQQQGAGAGQGQGQQDPGLGQGTGQVQQVAAAGAAATAAAAAAAGAGPGQQKGAQSQVQVQGQAQWQAAAAAQAGEQDPGAEQLPLAAGGEGGLLQLGGAAAGAGRRRRDGSALGRLRAGQVGMLKARQRKEVSDGT